MSHIAWEQETFASLLTYLNAHPSITELGLLGAPFGSAADFEARLRFASERRITAVHLIGCDVAAASWPLLTPFLKEGVLRTLDIRNGRLLHVPLDAAFYDALRGCGLERLTFCGLFGAALLEASIGHQTLKHVYVGSTGEPLTADDHLAIGPALCRLVDVNTPALTSLDLSFLFLGDACLRPVLTLYGATRTFDHSIAGTTPSQILPSCLRWWLYTPLWSASGSSVIT